MINNPDSFIEDVDTASFIDKVIKKSKSLGVIVDFGLHGANLVNKLLSS